MYNAQMPKLQPTGRRRSRLTRWFDLCKARLIALRHAGQIARAYHAGDVPEALAHARIVIAADSSHAWANFVVSHDLIERSRYGEALPYLYRVVAEWPDDHCAYYAVGFCYDALNNPEAALQAYRKASELAPNDISLFKNIGQNLYAIGENAESEVYLRHYCEVMPNDREAHDLLGYVCYQQGKYLQSYCHYERARALDPMNPQLDRNARLLYARAATS